MVKVGMLFTEDLSLADLKVNMFPFTPFFQSFLCSSFSLLSLLPSFPILSFPQSPPPRVDEPLLYA
jgi:hypothetical protein